MYCCNAQSALLTLKLGAGENLSMINNQPDFSSRGFLTRMWDLIPCLSFPKPFPSSHPCEDIRQRCRDYQSFRRKKQQTGRRKSRTKLLTICVMRRKAGESLATPWNITGCSISPPRPPPSRPDSNPSQNATGKKTGSRSQERRS